MRSHSRAIACLMFALCVGSSLAAMPAIANIYEQCGGTSCAKGECKDAEWPETK